MLSQRAKNASLTRLTRGPFKFLILSREEITHRYELSFFVPIFSLIEFNDSTQKSIICHQQIIFSFLAAITYISLMLQAPSKAPCSISSILFLLMSRISRLGRRLKSPSADIFLMLLSESTRWVVEVGIPPGMSSRLRWEQSTLVPSHLIRKSR